MKDEFNLSEKEKSIYGNFYREEDVKEFIKRQIDYQDLKIKLARENLYLNEEERKLIIACCLDNKIKLKQDSGDKLK